MAEDLYISGGTKEERYEALLPQLQGLLSGETDEVANLANVAAALKETFGFFWVGFYRVSGEELVGPLSRACGLYAHPQGAGRLWDGLAGSPYAGGARC